MSSAGQPHEAFVLLSLPNVSLTTPNGTENGTLMVECVTLPASAQASLERDVFLVLRVNALEVPLDPGRVISVKSVDSNGRSYALHGSYVDPTELQLAVSYSSHFLGGGIPLHEQEDLETFEGILSQYADFRGVSEDSKVSPTSSQPSEKIMLNREGPNDSRLRGQLVLVNEDTGEVVGEVEQKFNVKEDPGLAEKGHERDPVVIEIPEGATPTESAIDVFARTIPPEQQNWMTTGATLVSYAISTSTNLLVSVISGASNYYIAHSKPGTAKESSPSSSTPGTPGTSTDKGAPVFLTSERTRKGLANVHAVSTQAARVSSKTLGVIDSMIDRLVNGKSKKGKGPANAPVSVPGPYAGASSTSLGAPPPYSSSLSVSTDGKPALPPRRSPSPQPSSAVQTSAPPLPPRELGTKARLVLSADLILSTIDESVQKLLASGEKNISAVVGHKYGSEAAQTSKYMTGTARNVALVYIDVRGMGRKALLKRVGKTYVKNKMSSHKQQ